MGVPTKKQRSEVFATKLRVLRAERDVTQKQLADAIGTSEQSIVNWEKGDNLPSFEKACLLADYFDVPLDNMTGRGHVVPD